MKIARLHYVDALRASMMLLGPVFHAGLSFTVSPIDEFWPHKYASNDLTFDFISSLIHAFRIPVFFMIAGYFMVLQMKTRSLERVLSKRWRRIIVPLIVGLITLVPLVEFTFYYANVGEPSHFILSEAWAYFMGERGFSTSYLWFLHYLTIFYVLHTGVYYLKKKYNWPQWNAKLWAIGVGIGWFVFILISGKDTIHGDYHFLPKIPSLVFFGFFYFLGTLNWTKGWDKYLEKHGLRLVIWGFALFLILTGVRYLLLQPAYMDNGFIGFLEVLFIPPSTLCLSFGLIGLHIKYLNQHSSLVRYLSGSSYFIYLVNLPILVASQTILATVIPFIGVLPIVNLAITFMLSYGLYEVYRRLFPNGVLAH